MIHFKTKEEISVMREGGSILGRTLRQVISAIKPGVSELELDALAEKLIRQSGAEPGFKKVRGYRHTICVSTNDVVVHGIPTGYRFKEGDVVGIDCGVFYKGFHTDAAHTVRVQKSKLKSQNLDEIDKFLKIGEKALEEGIKVARGGNHVGHISKTIQNIIEGAGYCVVRSLVGHGVGRNLHEEPEVAGFLRGSIAKTPPLAPGMVIAVEVIYNQGKPEVIFRNNDGWTIGTKDQSLSGLFERTIAITGENPIVLTS
ncbi:type I methionyl aminopeptidase [Candidatus Microgenomates bacterium]|nr:type I methionyl aminopeptidase [Candidatus Microgenomates bacterium]